MLGYTIDEISGEHHRLFCEPGYAATPAYEFFWRKLRSGEFVTGEFNRVTKTGETVWIRATYNPIIDPDGKPMKVVGTGGLAHLFRHSTHTIEYVDHNLTIRGLRYIYERNAHVAVKPVE